MQVAHAFDFYANLTMIPAANLARVPVIIGSHRQLGDLMTPAQFRAQAAAFRWCDVVVCNSQAAADRLLAAGLPAAKIGRHRQRAAQRGFRDAAEPLCRSVRAGSGRHGRAHESQL